MAGSPSTDENRDIREVTARFSPITRRISMLYNDEFAMSKKLLKSRDLVLQRQKRRKGWKNQIKKYGKLPAFLTIVCGFVLGVSYWTGNMAIDVVSISSAQVNCRRFSLQISTLLQTPIDLAVGDSFSRSNAPADTRIQETIRKASQTQVNVSAHQSVVRSHLAHLRTSNFTISYLDLAFEDRVYVSCTNGMYSGFLECSLIADLLDVDGVFRRMRTVSLWDAATFTRIPWRTRGGGYESLKGPCDWMIGRGLMNPLPDGANCDFAQTNDWLNTMDGWMYAGYDPTLEPFYVAAPRAPEAMVWGIPAVSSQSAAGLVVQLSRGIFDQAGMFRGVGTSSVRLQSVDDLIKAWPLDNTQAIVVAFDNTGAVLGTSLLQPIVTATNLAPNQVTSPGQGCSLSQQNTVLCRSMITDSAFFPPLADLARVSNMYTEDFSDRMVIMGQRYYVSKQQVPVSGSTGLRWYVILFVPNRDLQFNIWLITVPVVGGIVFLVFSFLVYSVYQKSRVKNKIRDCRNAPIIGDVALIFTDIQNSTLLWNTIPAEMKVATEQHHSIIRGIIAEYKAYEVKTIGDSFMIACKDAETAINICNAIQTKLLHADWPERLLKMDDCRVVSSSTSVDESNRLDSEKDRIQRMERADTGLSSSSIMRPFSSVFRGTNDKEKIEGQGHNAIQTFRGIRVRVGVHIGKAETVWDEVVKGYDYYGEVVNKAARVEGLAFGGQTLVSKELYNAMPSKFHAQCCVRLVGTKTLKGIVGVCEIYSVLPNSLAARDTELKKLEELKMKKGQEPLMPTSPHKKNLFKTASSRHKIPPSLNSSVDTNGAVNNLHPTSPLSEVNNLHPTSPLSDRLVQQIGLDDSTHSRPRKNFSFSMEGFSKMRTESHDSAHSALRERQSPPRSPPSSSASAELQKKPSLRMSANGRVGPSNSFSSRQNERPVDYTLSRMASNQTGNPGFKSSAVTIVGQDKEATKKVTVLASMSEHSNGQRKEAEGDDKPNGVMIPSPYCVSWQADEEPRPSPMTRAPREGPPNIPREEARYASNLEDYLRGKPPGGGNTQAAAHSAHENRPGGGSPAPQFPKPPDGLNARPTVASSRDDLGNWYGFGSDDTLQESGEGGLLSRFASGPLYSMERFASTDSGGGGGQRRTKQSIYDMHDEDERVKEAARDKLIRQSSARDVFFRKQGEVEQEKQMQQEVDAGETNNESGPVWSRDRRNETNESERSNECDELEGVHARELRVRLKDCEDKPLPAFGIIREHRKLQSSLGPPSPRAEQSGAGSSKEEDLLQGLEATKKQSPWLPMSGVASKASWEEKLDSLKQRQTGAAEVLRTSSAIQEVLKIRKLTADVIQDNGAQIPSSRPLTLRLKQRSPQKTEPLSVAQQTNDSSGNGAMLPELTAIPTLATSTPSVTPGVIGAKHVEIDVIKLREEVLRAKAARLDEARRYEKKLAMLRSGQSEEMC